MLFCRSESTEADGASTWRQAKAIREYAVMATLVERATRFTMLIPLKLKDAQTVRKAYAKALTKLPIHLVRSIMYDQGKK